MRHSSTIRPKARGRAPLVLLLLALVMGGMPAGADPLDPFCMKGRPPSAIDGQGTQVQLALHYQVWLPSYAAKCREALGTITYYGTSDNLAANAMLARNGMFFGREVPLTPVEQTTIEWEVNPDSIRGRFGTVQHIPVYLESMAVAYRLDCTDQPLKLTGENLALIFAGLIGSWNDPLLVRDNPALADCPSSIRVGVRADEAGATRVFKDYLSKKNPLWRPFTLPELNTAWPPTTVIDCKGGGDAGVAGCVSKSGSSIGYMSRSAAVDAGLRQAQIDNAQGVFASASQAGCVRAAETAPLPPSTTGDWSSVSLTNPPEGYALCNFGLILAWQDYRGPYPTVANPEMVRNLRDYLQVALQDAVQAKLKAVGLTPLPPRVLALSRAGVNSIEV